MGKIKNPMKITLNGQEKQLDASPTLRQIIEQFCKQRTHVIAEINGEIIKSPQWEKTSLKDGDTIELVSLVGGG